MRGALISLSCGSLHERVTAHMMGILSLLPGCFKIDDVFCRRRMHVKVTYVYLASEIPSHQCPENLYNFREASPSGQPVISENHGLLARRD